jgi:hypothetical protein
MATVLTDKNGNPLWIPSDTPGRGDWEEPIYGIKNIKRIWYDHPRAVPDLVVTTRPTDWYGNYWFGFYKRDYPPYWAKKKPPMFGPVFVPFWQYYGFITEEDLDDYLIQYAPKLVNFDWEEPLRTIYNILDALVQWHRAANRNPPYPYPYDEVELAKQLYAAEYLYYLGPIKFALKYNLGAPFVALALLPNTVGLTPMPSSTAEGGFDTIRVPCAAGRNTIIVRLYDGTDMKLDLVSMADQVTFNIKQQSYELSGEPYWAHIFPILKLPAVISVEASDEIIPRDIIEHYDFLPEEVRTKIYPYDQAELLARRVKQKYIRFKAPHVFSETAQTSPSATATSSPTTAPSATATSSPTTAPSATATSSPTTAPSATATSSPTTASPTMAGSSGASVATQSKLTAGTGSLGLLVLGGIVLYLLLRRH